MNKFRRIAVDPGFGGFKIAEVTDGEAVNVAVLPAVVGIGKGTDVGFLDIGLKRTRKQDKPLQVNFNGRTNYLVGHNVHLYARPRERLDFARLEEGPEMRALLYGALWQILGSGSHELALIIGLPVEIVQDRDRSQQTLRTLRRWLLGDHVFNVGAETVHAQVTQIKALAQPVGAYFSWGANLNGKWQLSREALSEPVAICDIGFNTLDLFVVEQGQVAGRYTGGDHLGMHRVADAVITRVRRAYNVNLSLYQADQLMRAHLKKPGRAQLHHHGGSIDLGPMLVEALDEAFAGINQFVRRHWEQGTQFRHLLLAGGGAQALKTRLLGQYPQAIILPEPVTANAVGIAKFARRPGVFKS